MLNECTVNESYAQHRTEEVSDCVHGARYFTTIDMKSVYHQIDVAEGLKERTGFTVYRRTWCLGVQPDSLWTY